MLYYLFYYENLKKCKNINLILSHKENLPIKFTNYSKSKKLSLTLKI